MPFRPTWAAMFEPELYPPPPLTGFGFAWRYAVAIGSFFAMAAVWVLAFQARSTGVLLDIPITPEEIGSLPPVWWAVLDPDLGANGLATIHLRLRFPLVLAEGTAV